LKQKLPRLFSLPEEPNAKVQHLGHWNDNNEWCRKFLFEETIFRLGRGFDEELRELIGAVTNYNCRQLGC
jgi:hypothetical protein